MNNFGDPLITRHIRICVRRGDVVKSDQILAFVGQIENADGTEVINLQGLADRIIETDACCCVNDEIELIGKLIAHSRINTETRKH